MQTRGIWWSNPPFCRMKRQKPAEQVDNLQNKGFGPFKLRGLPGFICYLQGSVPDETQGWGETLLLGGKHCPLWGVRESWQSLMLCDSQFESQIAGVALPEDSSGELEKVKWGNTIRGNRTESLREGDLALRGSLRGPLKTSEEPLRTSENL